MLDGDRVVSPSFGGWDLHWDPKGPEDVFAGIRKAIPSMAEITWERLEQEHSPTPT